MWHNLELKKAFYQYYLYSINRIMDKSDRFKSKWSIGPQDKMYIKLLIELKFQERLDLGLKQRASKDDITELITGKSYLAVILLFSGNFKRKNYINLALLGNQHLK